MQLFGAIIYLPMIVISMIISQIYFERYWEAFKGNRVANIGLTIVISVIYFIQEYCLCQLSAMNIGEVVFMQVVSVTMLFRDEHNRLWWMLMVLTPFFTFMVKVLMGRENIDTWWLWATKAVVLFILCLLLVGQHKFRFETRYALAISTLSLFEIGSLIIEQRVSLVNMAAVTLGFAVILFFEDQRYQSEVKNEEKIRLLQKESERDDLTGLLNYRALSQEISALTERKEIHNIVIGGLDIDHFKRINDTYGHFVGNEVLNYFSTVFREKIHQAFPNHGYVYRFGGEEFTILVSNHSISEVYQLLQSIEEQFNNEPIVTKDGIEITISFSCSLTNHLSGEMLDLTLKRADRMLYSVKNNGRGWIVTDHHRHQPQRNVAMEE